MGSFLVLAGSGLAINLLVAGLRDADALGVFNQAYAVYMIASQVAVFGLHYSAMRHAALHEGSPEERGALLAAAALAALLLGLAAGAGVFAASGLLGRFFDSPDTGRAIRWSAAGLVLFPLNKVLLGYLNGLRRMKAFALIQSLRYAAVTGGVAAVAAGVLPFPFVTLSFAAAEVLTLGALAAVFAAGGLLRNLAVRAGWLRRHFAFGGKSLVAGMFVEVNSRLDVILLGFFVPDRSVGIYSFASMLVDGLLHLLTVVRINLNPILVQAVRDRDWRQAGDLIAKTRRYVYPAMLGLSLLILAGFWIAASWILPAKGLHEGMLCLVILLAGLTAVSGLSPFENLLLSGGFPGYQAIQHASVMATGLLLNVLLIPVLGLEGAALAAVAGLVVGIAVLTFLTRRLLSWDLLRNRATG
jgi:O-antigen/teichoic acid export membrane protein